MNVVKQVDIHEVAQTLGGSIEAQKVGYNLSWFHQFVGEVEWSLGELYTANDICDLVDKLNIPDGITHCGDELAMSMSFDIMVGAKSIGKWSPLTAKVDVERVFGLPVKYDYLTVYRMQYEVEDYQYTNLEFDLGLYVSMCRGEDGAYYWYITNSYIDAVVEAAVTIATN